jgi:hypothetical protein
MTIWTILMKFMDDAVLWRILRFLKDIYKVYKETTCIIWTMIMRREEVVIWCYIYVIYTVANYSQDWLRQLVQLSNFLFIVWIFTLPKKQHYVVLQRMLINVYFRICERTPFEKYFYGQWSYIYILEHVEGAQHWCLHQLTMYDSLYIDRFSHS